MTKPLTPKQAAFVAEYLIDLNATQAAIRAGYSARTANEQGARLLAHVSVRAAIVDAQAERARRVEIDQDAVLRRWVTIATADPRELIEYRRTCCRHCYGVAFGYQLTQGEKVRKRKRALEIGDVLKDADDGDVVFGGIGWDPRKPPVDECPECFGEGVQSTYIHDTRILSPAAAMLYAGVKETKDGIQVLMSDRDAAMVNIAKHLGMFTEKVELTGKDGGPILVDGVDVEDLSAEELAALATQLAGKRQ